MVLRCSLGGAIEPEPPASLSPPATPDAVSGTRENEVPTRPDLGAAELAAGLCLHVPQGMPEIPATGHGSFIQP